jgi:high-affinity iron transporter
MLANLLIGLREGIEAALLIGVLVATLKKQGRASEIKTVLIGVAAAIAVSAVAGLLLALLVADVEGGLNQIISASASIIAVVFVTWMIFWMSRHSASLAGEIQGKLTNTTTGIAVAVIGFFAVVREGIETSIFLWSSTAQSGQGASALVGAGVGFLLAGVAGYGIYRGSLTLNLKTFFRFTGGYLIILSAGILASAVAELEELHWFNFLQSKTYDVSSVITEDSPIGFALKSLIGFNAAPTLLQSLVWGLYSAPICYLFVSSQRAKTA